MELGISVGAQDSIKAIPLLKQWSDMLRHVQFYLNANLSLEDEHIPIGGPGTIDLVALYHHLRELPNIYGILENDLGNYSVGLEYIKEHFLAK